MLIRKALTTAICITGACFPGLRDRMESRRAERAERAPVVTSHISPTAPVTPADTEKFTEPAAPVKFIAPEEVEAAKPATEWKQIKVCDGKSCHMEWRQVPVKSAKVVGKVAAKAASCGCGHPDCNCGANCNCPDCPGNTRSQKVTSQPATTTTHRTYRSGPVRRLFGGRR